MHTIEPGHVIRMASGLPKPHSPRVWATNAERALTAKGPFVEVGCRARESMNAYARMANGAVE